VTHDLAGLEAQYIKYFNPIINRKGKNSQDIPNTSGYDHRVPDNPDSFLNWYANLYRQETQIKEDKEDHKERVITLVDELGSIKPRNKCKTYAVQPCGYFRLQSNGETIYTDKVQPLQEHVRKAQNSLAELEHDRKDLTETINRSLILSQEIEDLLVQRHEIDDALELTRRLYEESKLEDHSDDKIRLSTLDSQITEARTRLDLERGRLENRKQYEDENGLSHPRKTLFFHKK
jgi:hypothetical protein